MMTYQVGKERSDGKFNVWRKMPIDKHRIGWVIVRVYDDPLEALEWAVERNQKLKKEAK